MQRVDIRSAGLTIDFSLARRIGDLIAERDNDQATLISWCDAGRGVHSPQGLLCEIKGEPGWQVYGRNHGGRLRISFNDEGIVLIYS